jgi:hypothetical protein
MVDKRLVIGTIYRTKLLNQLTIYVLALASRTKLAVKTLRLHDLMKKFTMLFT